MCTAEPVTAFTGEGRVVGQAAGCKAKLYTPEVLRERCNSLLGGSDLLLAVSDAVWVLFCQF